jgi:hypothetical protein
MRLTLKWQLEEQEGEGPDASARLVVFGGTVNRRAGRKWRHS